mmetsp:Transcript_11387/g.32038  ORF Transcript_11387/g.32038 Transcript_11387/m.32038 type:complete len:209 (-) Transcript_11387:111-737(-)
MRVHKARILTSEVMLGAPIVQPDHCSRAVLAMMRCSSRARTGRRSIRTIGCWKTRPWKMTAETGRTWSPRAPRTWDATAALAAVAIGTGAAGGESATTRTSPATPAPAAAAAQTAGRGIRGVHGPGPPLRGAIGTAASFRTATLARSERGPSVVTAIPVLTAGRTNSSTTSPQAAGLAAPAAPRPASWCRRPTCRTAPRACWRGSRRP